MTKPRSALKGQILPPVAASAHAISPAYRAGKRSLAQGCADAKIVTIPNGVPEPPIRLDGRAMELWCVITPEAVRLGLLMPANAALFAQACQTWQRYCIAMDVWERQAEADGSGRSAISLSTGKGGEQVNPVFTQATTLQRTFQAEMAELGLTPKMAVRFGHVIQSVQVDPAEEFFT